MTSMIVILESEERIDRAERAEELDPIAVIKARFAEAAGDQPFGYAARVEDEILREHEEE